MLKPEYLAGLADNMVEIFSETEADIVADVARRVVKTGEFTDTALWQVEKARQLGFLHQDTARSIANAAKMSEGEVTRLMMEAGEKALAYDDAIYTLAGFTPLGLSESPTLSAIIMQGVDSTNRLLNNFTQTRASMTEVAFRNLTDKAYLQTISGAFDQTTAIRNAIRELARNDIATVAYPSGAEHGVDYAVRRAVTTGINQSVAKLQLARADEMGCDLVEVTSHAGARPSHAVWQGQIYCIKGYNKRYKDFYQSTGYGSGDGLCGWNCYHSFYPFFEGLSTPSFERDPSAAAGRNNDEDYELSQKQRYYERQIREAKRECMAYQSAMDSAPDEATANAIKEDYTAASIKLKRREARLTQFIDETGRTRLNDRESTGLWSVAEANRARGAAQTHHTQWLKSINATDTPLNTVAKYYEGKYNNSPEYQLLAGYSRAVEKGEISPLVGLDLYRQTSAQITRTIVGQTTSDGVKIESFATHFINRIIGQTSTPHEDMRCGVPVEDALDALLHPKRIRVEKPLADGDTRQVYYGENAMVTISTRDNRLIQTNPK